MSQTTIRVTFGNGSSSDGAHLSAEVDSRPAGLNGGKTGFAPGDNVWFLLYKSDNVEIESVVASAGTVEKGSSLVVTKEDTMEFADSNSASINIPVLAISEVQWYGHNLGALTLQEDKTTVLADQKGIGVCKVTYQAEAQAYKLISPASVPGNNGAPIYDFSILVVVKGNVIAPEA